MKTLKFNTVVVGAGPGGYPCAIRLGQLGVETLCIERDSWGGVCLNVGCIPSKALITAGKRMEEIRGAAAMGITVGEPSIDMVKLQEWKQGIVTKLTGGVAHLLKANKVETLKGNATFVGPKTLEVDTADGKVKVECENLVLATGSRPIEIPGFSYADARICDSTKALALNEVPGRVVVIGGGYIGLELGQMLRKVGAEVTVVEMSDDIMPGFDPDVVKLLNRKLKKSGITVLRKTAAKGWEESDDGAVVKVEGPDGAKEIPADAILVTVGRRPNSEGLEATGVTIGPKGQIEVDSQLKTNVPGVYAIGDVAEGMMLAHKASHDGEIAAEVIAGHNAHNDAKTVPAVVFTDPEIATAGMMEHEAKAEGYEVKVGKMPFAALGRAMTTNTTEGFIKVILDAEDDRVLGVTITGPHASDLISECALAVEMDAEAMDIGLTIHPHPTLGEGVMEATKAALGQAIHVVNR
ncbi:MAG: dihydrolipoyl dehydrogenase [Myxococcota bacterium]